jgi:DNA-directed RNA polymerase II subunit RPB2
MILPQEDMPFTKDGITPDIIMNPHAFPKRMTIGQILEVIFSKVAAITGKQYDGTPFSGQNIEPLGDLLEKLGFEKYGNELLYNGMTGEQIESEIFMGPCYYQKLKHMVLDKIHSRARGPVSMINRQPLEGRSKDGGLRLGEMERDGLISHSIAQFLKERFYDCSDGYTPKGNYTIIVCNTCGFYAIQNKNTNEYRCRHPDCLNKNNKYSEVYLPYATKTFIQELMAQCVVPRIIPEEPTM